MESAQPRAIMADPDAVALSICPRASLCQLTYAGAQILYHLVCTSAHASNGRLPDQAALPPHLEVRLHYLQAQSAPKTYN